MEKKEDKLTISYCFISSSSFITTNTNLSKFISKLISIASLVVPATSETITAFLLTIAFIKLDFPLPDEPTKKANSPLFIF